MEYSLSQEDVDAHSVNCFKSWLEKRRARQMDFFLKKDSYSLQVLSAARKVNQEDVDHQDQDVTSMPGAAAPGKYPVNTKHQRIQVQTFHDFR